jgi:hypothetical protein
VRALGGPADALAAAATCHDAGGRPPTLGAGPDETDDVGPERYVDDRSTPAAVVRQLPVGSDLAAVPEPVCDAGVVG